MGKSHNPDNKTKALGNQNPNILQANWPAGLTLGKSASVSQRDVTAQSTNAFLLISPEQNHIRRVTCTLSALGHTFLQTRHWISGLRLLLRTKSHRTAAGLPGPAAGCEFDPGGGGPHRSLSHAVTGFIWVFSVYLDPFPFDPHLDAVASPLTHMLLRLDIALHSQGPHLCPRGRGFRH